MKHTFKKDKIKCYDFLKIKIINKSTDKSENGTMGASDYRIKLQNTNKHQRNFLQNVKQFLTVQNITKKISANSCSNTVRPQMMFKSF